jgi:hypothetical protein
LSVVSRQLSVAKTLACIGCSRLAGSGLGHELFDQRMKPLPFLADLLLARFARGLSGIGVIARVIDQRSKEHRPARHAASDRRRAHERWSGLNDHS